MTLIVTPKNKKEVKALKAFLESLSIGFYEELEEDKALHQAMQKGRTTTLLTKANKTVFLNRIKGAK